MAMHPSPSELRIAFSNALRAFQTGGLSYDDLLAEIDQQRIAGASADELLAVLQRREYVEPLSSAVHEAVVAHLLLEAADSRRLYAADAQASDIQTSADVPARAMVVRGRQDAGRVAVPDEVDQSFEITSPILPAALQHRGDRLESPAHVDPIGGSGRRSVFPVVVGVLLSAVLLGGGSWFLHEGRLNVNTAHRAPDQSIPVSTVRPAQTAPPQIRKTMEAGMKILDCPECPDMVILPAGRFTQGSAGNRGEGASSEGPRHQVTIDYLLALATSDVTVAEFRQFVLATGRDMQGCDTYDGEWRARRTASWLHPGFAQTGSHPVTCVSWDDAAAYAAWLSQKSGHRYRLPTAAEWEYAAQSDAARLQPVDGGGSSMCTSANVADLSAARRYPGWNAFNCEDGFVYTSPVGTYPPDAFGLSDMLGNVFQWTEDCWHPDYADAPSDGSARAGVDCAEHELRGGSWFSSPKFVRTAARNHFAAGYRTSSVGFRLARDMR